MIKRLINNATISCNINNVNLICIPKKSRFFRCCIINNCLNFSRVTNHSKSGNVKLAFITCLSVVLIILSNDNEVSIIWFFLDDLSIISCVLSSKKKHRSDLQAMIFVLIFYKNIIISRLVITFESRKYKLVCRFVAVNILFFYC